MKATDDLVSASANPSALSATSSTSLRRAISAEAARIPSSASAALASLGSAVSAADKFLPWFIGPLATATDGQCTQLWAVSRLMDRCDYPYAPARDIAMRARRLPCLLRC